MSKFILTILLSIFVSFLVSSCSYDCAVHPGRSGYLNLRNDFKTENEDEVLKRFQSRTVNEQLDIYLFSCDCVEAGRGGISILLSKDFEPKMPIIAQRIRTSNDIKEKVELFGLFSYPHSAMLKKHPEIVQVLYDAEPEFTDADDEDKKRWKNYYNKQVENLKEFLNQQ